MNITKITFTGADDATNLSAMMEMSRKDAFIEWGILVGTHQGGPRWPSAEFFGRLAERAPGECPGMQLALHLCGEPLSDVLNVGARGPLVPDWVEAALPLFQRVQLNFHGESVRTTEVPRIADAFSNGKLAGKEAIVQLDSVNNWVLDRLLDRGINASGLHDLSHGAGVTPECWPDTNDPWTVGYAGGLGPENIQDELQRLHYVAKKPFWIDMETRVRSVIAGRDRFDLGKCARVVELVRNHPWGVTL